MAKYVALAAFLIGATLNVAGYPAGVLIAAGGFVYLMGWAAFSDEAQHGG